ncbi:MAG: hypothetical protein D6689_15880 [Deltaproteobacteria bacterium]|nr:MAG: hypothetical protein D6689_15880 [Deltaproteobacteria bacterium]
MLRAARRGLVHVDPPLASVLPAPDGDVLQRAFDALVPDGTAIVAYAFDDGASDLFASIIASKEAGDIVFATTHMGIADAIDARHVARDWRSRYRRILDVVDERFDPPSIGVFFERGAVARILGGPPDQLGREIARKHVIVDPAPLWLSALAGGAAVAGTAGAAARSLSRLLPRAARESARAVAGGVARQARAQLRSAGLDPVDLLGFDPVAVWNELRALMRGATR